MATSTKATKPTDANTNGVVEYFDIASKQPISWTPFTARGRMVLNFKRIPHTTTWISFPDIAASHRANNIPPKLTNAWLNLHYTIPAIRHRIPGQADIALQDSLPVALYLEKAFPDSLHLPWAWCSCICSAGRSHPAHESATSGLEIADTQDSSHPWWAWCWILPTHEGGEIWSTGVDVSWPRGRVDSPGEGAGHLLWSPHWSRCSTAQKSGGVLDGRQAILCWLSPGNVLPVVQDDRGEGLGESHRPGQEWCVSKIVGQLWTMASNWSTNAKQRLKPFKPSKGLR